MKTNKFFWLTFLAGVALLFASCQKEVDFQDLNGTGGNPGGNPGGGGAGGGGNAGSILGDYNFIGVSSKQENSVTVTQAGMTIKAVALTEYTSENNVGTLKITGDKFFFTGIGHTVNGTANVLTYIDGALFGLETEPYSQVTDPADQTYDYVRNNSDSLTFTNGFAMLPDASGNGMVPTGPIGMKISMSNDTLTLVTKFAFTSSVNQGGVPGVIDVNADGIMKFKKK